MCEHQLAEEGHATHPLALVELIDRGVHGRLIDADAAHGLYDLPASEKGGEDTI